MCSKLRFALIGLLVFGNVVCATTCYFNGTMDTDWGTAGNWQNGIPTSADFAVLTQAYTGPRPAHAVISSGSYSTKGMTIGNESATTIFILDVNGGTLTNVAAGTVTIANMSADSKGVMNVNAGGTYVSHAYIHLGRYGSGTINVNGGTFTADGSDLQLGVNDGNGTFNVSGGTANINTTNFRTGSSSNVVAGTQQQINVTGGTLNATAPLYLGYTTSENTLTVSSGTANFNGGLWVSHSHQSSGHSHLQLDGGLLHAATFSLNPSYGSADITEGQMKIDNDCSGYLQGLVGQGLLTAYGGEGTVNIVFDETHTVVTGISGAPPEYNCGNPPFTDIKRDCIVDFEDYAIIASGWQQQQPIRQGGLPDVSYLWPTYRHDNTLAGISPITGGLSTEPNLLWSVSLAAPLAAKESWYILDFNGDINYEVLRIIPIENKLICQNLLGQKLWEVNDMPGAGYYDCRDYAGNGGRGLLFRCFTGTQYKWYIVDGNTGARALLYTSHDYYGDDRRIGHILPSVQGQQICAWWDGDDNPVSPNYPNRVFEGYIWSFENGVANPNRRFFVNGVGEEVWVPLCFFEDMDKDGQTETVMISYEKAWIYNTQTSAKKAQMSWNLSYRDRKANIAAIPLRPGQYPSFLIINPFIPGLMVINQNGSSATMLWKKVIGPVESEYQSALTIGPGAPDPFIDLDSNGTIEMITAITNEHGDGKTNLVIFSADTNERLLEMQDRRIISAEDLDKDGQLEIFVKESNNISPAPGAWATSGNGNEIPVVNSGDTLHIARFKQKTGGGYELNDVWSGSANPFLKPQPPEYDLKRSFGNVVTYLNPVIWRTTPPDSNEFLMKFGSTVWSCRLSGGTLQQIEIITVHEALGNNPPPPSPAQTYAWQGNTLITYVDGNEVYRQDRPMWPSYLAPPPIVGELGGKVRIITRGYGGTVLSFSSDGTDQRTLLTHSPAYQSSTHVYNNHMILCDIDSDGSNELLTTIMDGNQPKVVAVDANGNVKLTILPVPNATDLVLMATGSLGPGNGRWITIRCNRLNATTAVAAYNGKTGQQMWVRESFGVSGGNPVSFTASIPTSTYDYNADGKDDLVLISDLFYGIIDVKNNVNLVDPCNNPFFSYGVPAHWTAYGVPMLVDMLHTGGQPQIVIGASWCMLWTADLLGHPIWHWRLSPDNDTMYGGREGLADLNGDSKIEVVMSQQDGLLRAFGADPCIPYQKCPMCPNSQPLTSTNRSANPLWQYTLNPPVSDFASADVDADSKVELLCGARDGLYALKQTGSTCGVLWKKDLGRTVGSPVFADINNDGLPEILVTTEDGYLRCLGHYRIDLNNDGVVDYKDIAELAESWLWSGL